MLPEEGEAERMPMRLSPLAYAVVIAAAGVIVAGVVPQFFMVLSARAFPY
jgi:hypothetical protein